MTILLVVHSVSQPRRVFTLLSSAMSSLTSLVMKASRIASEIWSQTLSGCPSETRFTGEQIVRACHLRTLPCWRRLMPPDWLLGRVSCSVPVRGQDVGRI